VRTLAIINQKGGCGKTTVAINLAAVLAQRGHKTLLVDMDPQSHCALGLAVPEAQIERSMADLMQHGLDGSMVVSDVVWQISRKLDLAPSDMGLAAIEQELANAPDRDRRLAQILATASDLYEFCIIDCPPSIGLITFNALRAADEIISPVETGYFAMQGAVKQDATIEMLARRVGHRMRISVLPTMYDVRTKLAREILNELRRQFGDKLLPITINFNSKLKEAASFGQPITEYDAASRGMQDFDKLAAWLIANPPAPVMQEIDGAAPKPAESSNPALSRAAELVERARALASRTAALSARLNSGEVTPAEAVEQFHQDGGAAETPRDAPPAAPTARPTLQPVSSHDADPAAGNDRLAAATRHAQSKPSVKQRLAQMYGVRRTSQGALFVQPVDEGGEVCIAGDFNDWKPQPMSRDESLGVYQTCIPLEPGRYRYRLVVDGQWRKDPYNQTVETNPFGELDNIVEMAG